MRTRELACHRPLLALALTLMGMIGVSAAAGDPNLPPSSCSTAHWKIVAVGPTYVDCGPDCVQTKIRYNISRTPAPFSKEVKATQAATLVRGTEPATPAATSGIQKFAACVGDNVTGLGRYDCSAWALRFDSQSYANSSFEVVVDGRRQGIKSSVALRANYRDRRDNDAGSSEVEACGIIGLSYVPLADPKAATSTTEFLTFEGCTMALVKSATTGEVLDAFIDTEKSTPGCTLDINKLSDLRLTIAGVPVEGPVNFGEGQISTGLNSCSTRLIGGKLYTVCTP